MSPSESSSLTTNAKAEVHHNLSCQCPLIFFMALITMWNHIDYLLTYLMLVSFILLTTLSSVHKQGGLYGYSTDTYWMNKWSGGANVTLKYHCLVVTQRGQYAGSRKWQGFFSQKRMLFTTHGSKGRQMIQNSDLPYQRATLLTQRISLPSQRVTLQRKCLKQGNCSHPDMPKDHSWKNCA